MPLSTSKQSLFPQLNYRQAGQSIQDWSPFPCHAPIVKLDTAQRHAFHEQPTFQGSPGHTAAKASRSSFPFAAEVVGGYMSSRMLITSCLLCAPCTALCSLPEKEQSNSGTEKLSDCRCEQQPLPCHSSTSIFPQAPMSHALHGAMKTVQEYKSTLT